jgi:NTE family protein
MSIFTEPALQLSVVIDAPTTLPTTSRVMRTIAVPPRVRTAFVLAGGGSLGAAQVGMLRALVESGINADLVVGTSVGAINAAYFAGDPTTDGIARLAALWSGLKRTDILPLSWRGLFGFLRRRDHLVPSDGLRRLLDLHLPYSNLEDAALPVHVVATDILSGEAVVLSRGPATQAVLASSAIPAAFAPVQINGRLLCDGAIASNTPVRVAAARGARRLIVLPTGSASRLKCPPNGAIATALHAITLLTTRQLAAELNDLDSSAECHVLPTEGTGGGSPLDFSRTSELLERSYRRTLQWLDDGGLDRRVGLPFQRSLRRGGRGASSELALTMVGSDTRHAGASRLASAAQALGTALGVRLRRRSTHRYPRSIELRQQRYWRGAGERSYSALVEAAPVGRRRDDHTSTTRFPSSKPWPRLVPE